MLALSPVTPNAAPAILEPFQRLRFDHRGEQRLLDAAGFARAMPDDWDGEDALARYRKMGVELVENL